MNLTTGLDIHDVSRALVENNTGSDIAALKCVSFNGIGTTYPQVILANPASRQVFGIAPKAILSGGTGIVSAVGFILDINTSSWAPDTLLYSDASGNLVTSPVVMGAGPVAIVLKQDAVFGSIYVLALVSQFHGASGFLNYEGTWDASTGVYPASPVKGDYYVISVPGTISGHAYAIGDWITYNGTSWNFVDNSSYVTAVNGATGSVVVNAINQLTGDGTAGPATMSQSAIFTLATVNANTGSFGSSTAIPNFTVNAKGLITAAGTSAVVAPAGTLTGSALASNVLGSALTSVGTLNNLFVSGNVGINTLSPVATLDVETPSTALSGFIYGLKSLVSPSPTSASSAQFKGIGGSVVTPTGNTQNIYLQQAMSGMVNHEGSGIVTYATALDGEVYCVFNGTIQNAYGSYHLIQISNGGTINTGYGCYIASPVNNGGLGTFGTYYGLYIGTPTAAGTNYSIYSQGGQNYFGGPINAAGGITGTVNYTPSSPALWTTVPTTVQQALDDIPLVDQSKPRPTSFALYSQAAGPAVNTKYQSVTVAGKYAYVAGGGSGATLSIFDISNQAAPVLKSYLTLLGSYGVAVQGNYCYVPSSGGFVLYVVNISNPSNPTVTGSVNIGSSSGSLYSCVVSGNYCYVSTQSKGLTVIDVTNPASPTQVYQEGGTLNKSFGIAISGNTLYTTNYQTTSPWTVRYLKTWDITTPTAPNLLNTYTLPAGTKPTGINVFGNTAFVQDGNTNTIQVIDVTTPASPSYLSSLTPTGTFNTDFNAVVAMVGDNYVYVPSGSNSTYGGAIDMFDLTNRSAPIKIATTTLGTASSVFGGIAISNGYIYVGDYGVAPGSTGTLDVFTMPFETLVAGQITASAISGALKYTPATPGNWSGTAPSTVASALDRIAALLVTLNGGSPIP